MSPPTLYILYNADASVMGKLAYSYRKLTTKDKDKPACAACDITHGGLHLDETSQWKAAKAEVVESGAVKEVKQLHRDELDAEDTGIKFPRLTVGQTKAFVQSQELQYPMVLAKGDEKELKVLMSSEELAGFKGDPQTFMQSLKEKLT